VREIEGERAGVTMIFAVTMKDHEQHEHDVDERRDV